MSNLKGVWRSPGPGHASCPHLIARPSDLERIQVIPSLNSFVVQERKLRSGQGKEGSTVRWPAPGRDQLRFQVPCLLLEFSFFYIHLVSTAGKTRIVLHRKPRSEQLCLECYQLACLFVESKKWGRNEKRRWTNLLQVRLGGGCYATREGGFTRGRRWVGSDWWLKAAAWVTRGRTRTRKKAWVFSLGGPTRLFRYLFLVSFFF